MKRRDFFKLAIGVAAAAVILPEIVAKKLIADLYQTVLPFPHIDWPVAGDLIAKRTDGGLDLYSPDGTYKGIFRI